MRVERRNERNEKKERRKIREYNEMREAVREGKERWKGKGRKGK